MSISISISISSPPTLSNLNPQVQSTQPAHNPNHLLSYKSAALDWKGYLSIIKTTRDPYPSFCVLYQGYGLAWLVWTSNTLILS